MGYSLSVRYPTVEACDAALARVAALDWPAVRAMHPRWASTRPVAGGHLTHAPVCKRGLLLGFNASLPNRLEWALAVWLACRSGHRQADGGPVVFFDREALPVAMRRMTPARGRLHADADGHVLPAGPWIRRLLERAESLQAQAVVRTLAAQWDGPGAPAR